MKRFILSFGIFCTLLIIGLLCLDFFLKIGQKNYDSHANYKLRSLLVEKSIDPEIIVFGSSIAECAFNPSIFSYYNDKKTFNAGLSGRRIIDWNCIAFSFLEYSKNNKIILLDIFPNVFNESDQLYQPHEFYPYLSDEFVKSALEPISPTYQKIATLPFYYFTQLNFTTITNSIVGIRDLIFNNHSKIDLSYAGYKNTQLSFVKSEQNSLIKTEISPRSVSLYEELFLKAAKKNIRVLLVGMPVYQEGRDFYQNLDSIYQFGEKWNKNYKNVDFINFLNDTSIVTKKYLFYNMTHLNDSGANIISKKVAFHLLDVNHRTDTAH